MTRANGVLHPGVTRARGFSLIDLAIVMTIVGVLLAGFLATYKLYQTTHAMAVTEQNFNAIQEAIGTYVTVYKRYPVPAGYGLADGSEGYGLSAESAKIVNCGSVPASGTVCKGADGLDSKMVLVGVVPFADLNIAPEQARDGYGRLFTYAVSEDLTANNGDDPSNYHVCVKKHVIDNAAGTSVDVNCEIPGPNNVDTGEWRDGVDYKAGNITSLGCITYRARNDHTSSAANKPGVSATTWDVYDFNPVKPLVILSHGRDGKGAWLPGGGRYLDCGGGIQAENCNYDGVFATSVTKAIPYVDDQHPGSCSTRAISTSKATADDDDMRTEIRENINLWAQNANEIANSYDYKVGIGVSTPKTPLDVSGAIKADRILSDEYCDDVGTCTKTSSIVGNDTNMNCSAVGMVQSIADNKVTCIYPAEKSTCASNEYIAGFDGYKPICKPLPASCGPKDHAKATSAPAQSDPELCLNGNASTPTGSDPWHWTCTNGGNTVNCSTIKEQGSCSDECGALRADGEIWCRDGSKQLLQCNNGAVQLLGNSDSCSLSVRCGQ